MYLLQLIANSLVLGTQIALVAAALYLVHSVGKITHFALGAIGAAVAYAAYYVVSQGGGPVLAFCAAALVASGLGLAAFLLLERFTARQEPLLGLLVTLGMASVIEAVISIIFGTDGKSFSSTILPVIYVGGIQITFAGAVTIIVGVLLALIVGVITLYTPSGRVLRGAAENSPSILALGINQKKARLVVYIVAALLSGFAVTMNGLHTALVPPMGFNLIVMAFIALLVGGSQDLRGIVIASYVISVIPEIIIGFSQGSYNLSPSWRLAIMFLIAFGALFFRPEGLFAFQKRKG
jgi:branched-chain amino acid transport system permease protein